MSRGSRNFAPRKGHHVAHGLAPTQQTNLSNRYMTALQLDTMNTQLWQNIGAIADSKPLMKRLSSYVARLVRERKDPTLMTEEEFLAKLERGEEDYRQGRTHRMLPGEDLDTFLQRVG